MRMRPAGRSISSYMTIMFSSGHLYQLISSRTLSPERFIYVCGCASTTRSAPKRPSPTRALHLLRSSFMPMRCEMTSTTLKPVLWRVN